MTTRPPAARYPGLDGLRAIAILLVIADHGLGPQMVPKWVRDLQPVAGSLGVELFFVLSGFLITALLLREQQATGGIRLGRFYRRRALRILPVFYLYIAVVALAFAAGWLAPQWRQLIPPATFTANYFGHSIVLGHFWSLSVEEQYYLTWPLALVLLGRGRGAMLAGAVWLGMPLLFTGLWHAGRAGLATGLLPQLFLAAGCLLALAMTQRPLPVGRMFPALAVLAGCFAWLAQGPSSTGSTLARIEMVVLAGILAMLVLAAASGAPGSRWLNARPLAWLGTLSYSLYVWQQLFLHWENVSAPGLVLRLAAVFACAMASYYGVERPFLRLKARLEAAGAAARRAAAG